MHRRERIMKKNIKLAAVLITTAILAAGCAKNSESAKDTTKDTTKESTTATASDVDYSKYVTLGTYKGIEVTKQSVEVTEEEIEAQIQSTLTNSSVNEEITDRDTVAEGDVANIDYEGLLDGVAFDGGTGQGYNLTIGSGQFIPGFEEQLVGAKVGEKISINVTFPEAYTEELAGKDVVFNVTINSISKEVVPELTDEFVQGISDAKTVDEYRQVVKEDLIKSKEDAAEATKQSDIWTAVKENCEIKEYPKELIDKYSEQITTMYSAYAEQAGVEMDEFMTTYFGMSLEDYAKQVAGEEMIFKLIVKDAGLTVSDDVFKTKADELASTYGYESSDALIETYGEDELKDSILWEVMMDYLSENAKEA
ncbi:trigger factor [Candidatus Galacturonibacter soehngenii]|uniref:Trigger factor n=2 Tax=Candidatus Galacturonatibacter soehngenii TaxID=2307010 RepID=A0A7V7UC27_9FIRM|nr:trigger factor [Candidatus Galacturonibacter soehngenii]